MPNMPSYDKPESGIIPLPQEATSLKNVKAEAKENAQEDRLYGDWTYVPRYCSVAWLCHSESAVVNVNLLRSCQRKWFEITTTR